MRLECLDLSRYGRFTDKRIDFAPPAADGSDLHILYGPNEAGKSTLFSAWMDLLFGIHPQTRYSFLHAGPTMQIGARLSEAGRSLEVRRLKRTGPSLFDAHGAALPEASLQALLGGLSREGYAAMFSLDDDTLEKGGQSILESRGDLGQMLFSASAGLAELAPRLNAVRAELDGFFNGKRSGRLIEAKKELAALQAQRKALEISASAVKTLARKLEDAEAAWRGARSAEDQAKAELDALQALAARLPLWQRLARLRAALAPLDGLARVGQESRATHETHETLEARRRSLAERAESRAARVAELEAKIAALALDPQVLALAAAIAEAEAARPEHDTALRDLPRRALEADEARLNQRRLCAELGADPARIAELLVPAAGLARLRSLLQRRSGVMEAAKTAEDERRKAAEELTAETGRLGDPGEVGEDDALALLLGEVKRNAPAEALRRAEEERDLARQRLEQALMALRPWAGDASALRGLAVPSPRQLADWERQLETARVAATEVGREEALLLQQLEALRLTTQGAAATGVDLAQVAGARMRREALWAEHRLALSPESAARFEAALREDDALVALMAQSLAEARRASEAALEEARITARLAALAATGRAAVEAASKTEAEILTASQSLGLPAATQLPQLRDWRAAWEEALQRAEKLAEAEQSLARAEASLARAAASLNEAQGLGALGFDLAYAKAVSRLEATKRRREARLRLDQLAEALAQREAAFSRATAARIQWEADWLEAGAGLDLLAHHGAGAGETLDRLQELRGVTDALATLEDRMAKMAINRDRFVAAKASVLEALQAPDLSWPEVMARLRRAEDAARDHRLIAEALQSEARDAAEDARAGALLAAQIADFGVQLGWDEAQGPLAEHLERCLTAASLREEIAALESELGVSAADAPPDAEPESLRARIEALRGDHQLLREASERAQEARLKAVQALEEVGGDEALVRIAAERAALLEELREQSRSHLAGRLGVMAVEAALLRYRDAHRSAMMERASRAFERLSRGGYTGLAAQPDGQREVLVALARDGAAKLAEDLSKGTRFQLYLALRVAGYHEMAQSRPTVPFIADDIMETFDDDRSLAAFGLLSEMSRAGQVIYLTHHRHLCDMAREANPMAKVIDLTQL